MSGRVPVTPRRCTFPHERDRPAAAHRLVWLLPAVEGDGRDTDVLCPMHATLARAVLRKRVEHPVARLYRFRWI